MNKKNEVSWERFLNPDSLKTNLILSSLFITIFEMLKDSIISPIKDFYTDGFKDG